MRPVLFQYFLKFDKTADCIPYQEGVLVNWQYTLSKLIDATRIKRFENSLEGKFKLKATYQHMLYNQVNDLCFVLKKQLDTKQEPFYTGFFFHF
jgi:hypothetical protein